MDGGRLSRLAVFVAVAKRLSFSAAARDLGVSTPAVSQAVARLERELSAALLTRTTRSVNLTDAGARLAAEAGPAIAAAGTALAAASSSRREPSGVLRLNVPRLAARSSIAPLIAAYVEAYPEMRVEVAVDDRNVDIVKEGFDAGVRLMEAVEKDMVTVRISGPIRFVILASPGYLAKHGRPKHPRELVEHTCLAWRSPTTGQIYRWEFEQRGRSFEVDVPSRISTSDADLLVACASEGLGLTYVAEHEARAELERGALVTVLEAFTPEVPGLFLYYPRASQKVPKLAALVACIRAASAAQGRNRTSTK